jgi:hypothetical protein
MKVIVKHPLKILQNLVENKMEILYIKATVVSVCVGSVWKILPITARSLWGQSGGGRGGGGARGGARSRKDRGRGTGEEKSRERNMRGKTERGELDECIMHRVHTNYNLKLGCLEVLRSMCDLVKHIFHIQVLLFYFFAITPIKLKTSDNK